MDYKKEAIEKFGNYYTINKNNPNEWLFPCKLCRKMNDANLHVNVKTGLYNCFHNCNNHGRLRTKYKLSDVLNNKEKQNTIVNSNFINDDLYPFYRKELNSDQLCALYSRGITDEQIKFYNICSGEQRIQIPNKVIGAFSDLVCNWEYRKNLITKENPKYLYSSGIKKSDIVFNLHNISNKPEIIIVCEGLFNAITAGKYAVATYGCNPSEHQIQLILNKKPKNIVLAYDSDTPGVIGSSIFIQLLQQNKYNQNLYYIFLPKGIDINDMGHKKFIEYLDKNKKKIKLNNPLSSNIPQILFKSLS